MTDTERAARRYYSALERAEELTREERDSLKLHSPPTARAHLLRWLDLLLCNAARTARWKHAKALRAVLVAAHAWDATLTTAAKAAAELARLERDHRRVVPATKPPRPLEWSDNDDGEFDHV